MATFDDDEFPPEIDSVDEYFFEDSDESAVPFSAMPVLFEDACSPVATSEKFFLRGVTDGGLRSVYKQVVGWKLFSGDDRAKVKVLIKTGKWITLLKPEKAYVLKERSTVVIVELLHFLMKEPNSLEESLWDHLCELFRDFEVSPSMEDVKDHSFIKLFMQRNEALATSPLLLDLLGGKSRNSAKLQGQRKDSDVADEDEASEGSRINGENNSQSGNLHDSDSFCAICDDGGDLVCCEGRCFRSFHATKAAGELSNCKSLGLTEEDVKATPRFICKNCMYEQHQCFVCGKLGSSNKTNGAEVYACESRTCGHFYHPKCIARCIYWDSKAEALDYEKKIESGKSFMCPLHHCAACKKLENKEVKESQLAICRRCPKAYHKTCLPRKIIVEDKSSTKRVWDDTKFDRIVMYCLKHSIDRNTGTPARDHIVFPDDLEKKKVASQKNVEINKKEKRKHGFSENPKDPKRRRKRSFNNSDKKIAAAMHDNKLKSKVAKQRQHAADNLHDNRTITEPVKTSEELSSTGTENGHFDKESAALSEKQKDETSSCPPHHRHAKTGKRVQIPFGKINQHRSLVYSRNARRIGTTNVEKKVTHKLSASLDGTNRNSMKPSISGRQSGKSTGKAKVIQTASQALDMGSVDPRAGSSQENGKMTIFKGLNLEKKDQMNVSGTNELQRSVFGNESSSHLPSLFYNVEQFVKPWSCVEANTEMHGPGSVMQPCSRGFALGPNEPARLIHTSFGWLDD